MPAKDKNPERTTALEAVIVADDLDGVLYRLTEIAVRRRDAADKPKAEGGNVAEARYWQRAIHSLHRAMRTSIRMTPTMA